MPFQFPIRKRGQPRKPQGLAPPFLSPADIDYQLAFMELAMVELEIQHRGLSEQLALRRGFVHFTLGNYLAAVMDAQTALETAAEGPEANFLKGSAMLAVAAVKHGVAQPGVGANLPRGALPPRIILLLAAKKCFGKVLDANPDDEQAQKGAAATDALLADVAGSMRR